MKIKYIGGRSRYEVSLNRKPYYFTPENDKTCDIQDQDVIQYIFHLPNSQEFRAVEEVRFPEPETIPQKISEAVNNIKVEIKKIKTKKGRK